MSLAAQIFVGLVALLHIYFLVLEMFLWKTPYGRRVFGTTPEQAESSAVLAGNQGLYNGFLSAGLIWSFFAAPAMVLPLRVFFLACVIVAGIYGAATANKRILFAQALPAAIALVLSYLAGS